MSNVAIIAVRLDEVGRLRLRPDASQRLNDYQFVYRDASWVRWDPALSELYVTAEKNESIVEQFDRICCAVVSEYGDRLVATQVTSFDSLPIEAVNHILQSA